MWPFRRRQRPAPTGTLRVGEHSSSLEDYTVLTVSESRHPQVFARLWEQASTTERDTGRVKRWAQLVPIHDPAFGVADMTVQFDGETACFLRPPHLGRSADQIAAAHVASLEVPSVIEWGPAGPTVRLRLE